MQHLAHSVYSQDYSGIQSGSLPWLSSLTVESVLVRRLRHRWSKVDYRILPLPTPYL